MNQYKQILTDGLWSRNPGLVQFLGICPLLAVSNTLVNGLALRAATTAVLSWPSGRSISPATMRNTAPMMEPTMERRPPRTVAMMICIVTVIATTVPGEAVPR